MVIMWDSGCSLRGKCKVGPIRMSKAGEPRDLEVIWNWFFLGNMSEKLTVSQVGDFDNKTAVARQCAICAGAGTQNQRADCDIFRNI